MILRILPGVFVAWLAALSPALADPMTLDYSWQGAKGCITLFPNPEILLHNIPPDAKLVLMQGTREMEGGAFYACKRHRASGKYSNVCSLPAGCSVDGSVIAEAHRARFYSTDELAPEPLQQARQR